MALLVDIDAAAAEAEETAAEGADILVARGLPVIGRGAVAAFGLVGGPHVEADLGDDRTVGDDDAVDAEQHHGGEQLLAGFRHGEPCCVDQHQLLFLVVDAVQGFPRQAHGIVNVAQCLFAVVGADAEP